MNRKAKQTAMSKARKPRIKSVVCHPAARLSEPEIIEMMLAPYLHLQQLLAEGGTNPHYLASIVGVINLATALAYMDEDLHGASFYESVAPLLVAIAHHGLDRNNPQSQLRLTRVFTNAERFVIAHSKADILRAVRLIEYQIEHGQGAIPLPAAA